MDVISFLGYCLIFIIVVRISLPLIRHVIWPFLVLPILDLKKDLKALAGGNWAVVTGATDGIGKAYARHLAKRGFNLVLVSRTKEKLDATALEIRETFPVDIRTVTFNFTECSTEVYAEKFENILRLDVGVLVNNVGWTFEYPERLHELPSEAVRDMIVVNCVSAALLSKMLLPQMVERKNGVVVNVSSASAFNPTPYLGVYSASKAFVDYLTRSLQLEYQNTGLTFQCVLPFFVATKMSKVKPSFFAPDPDKFVECAIKTVGAVSRTTGCMAHALQAVLLSFLPEIALEKHMVNLMQSLREKALRKKEEQNLLRPHNQ